MEHKGQTSSLKAWLNNTNESLTIGEQKSLNPGKSWGTPAHGNSHLISLTS